MYDIFLTVNTLIWIIDYRIDGESSFVTLQITDRNLAVFASANQKVGHTVLA